MSPSRDDILSPAWRDGLFTNKVLFCTGGAGTICSVQVRAFVALGGNAYIVGRNPTKTAAMAADIATVRPGATVLGEGNVDVRSYDALAAAVARCVEQLGGLDFAIAGAAGNFLAPISQLSANAFRSVMDIDAVGSYHTAKACLPHLVASARASGGNSGKASAATGTAGRMVFVSASFHYRGQALQAHVMAAKAAVDQISNAVAIEYGPYGVTSNVICPGPIEGTEGMERLSMMDEENVRKSKKAIPLGRWGRTKEIADATVFLFSDAGSYVNGNILVVDGGQWRTSSITGGGPWEYPDFLLGGDEVTGVKGGKKSKL